MGVDHRIFNADICAQKLKALDMLIHRADTEITSARHGNACLIIPAEQGADQIIRGTHVLGQFIGHSERIDGRGINLKRVLIDDAHPRANLL